MFHFDHSQQTGWADDGRAIPNSPEMVPDGYLFDTYPGRGDQFSATAITLTSGTPVETAIWLPANAVLTKCAYFHGTTVGVSLTHRWMWLRGYEGKVMAVTNDTTSTAPTASALNAFTFSASTRIPYSGIYYLGVCAVFSGTAPVLAGFASISALNSVPPILAGTGPTGQTTPPAVAALLAQTVGGANFAYGVVG